MRCVQVGKRKGFLKLGPVPHTAAGSGGGPQLQALFVCFLMQLCGLASFIVFSVNVFLDSTAVHEKNPWNAKLGLELIHVPDYSADAHMWCEM